MKSYQFPNSNLFTHHLLFFSREATSETYDPRVSFSYICLCNILFLCIYFQIYFKPKIQKYFAALYFICDLFIQSITISRHAPISGTVTRKGLTTPLTCRVARICYLCVGAVYVVLLGSPTGSITSVSHLREIPTAAVLHHPFLFGEIPT